MRKNIKWLGFLFFIGVLPSILDEISPYYINVFILVGIYVILAVSLDLLVGFTGQISVGHAAFFAIGAYTSGILTTNHGVSPMFALVAGLFVSGLIAWLVGWSVLSLKGYYLAMATMGLNAIIYTLIIGLQELTGGATGLSNIPSFGVFGFVLADYKYYYLVWLIVLLVLASCVRLVKSPLGRTLNAIHGDEVAARTLGVDSSKYKLNIFVLSSVYAALAGSLFTHYMGFISPNDFSIRTSIDVLIMVFLGGVGTIYGPAFGAFFLKYLPEITYRFEDYELLLHGLILISVLAFMPKGLIGLFTTLTKKVIHQK